MIRIESRDNHSAIMLEPALGFSARACPDDPSLVLLEKSIRSQIERQDLQPPIAKMPPSRPPVPAV